ncbi:hypothetical protein EUX98_g9123 [Antrodiella citrinella]|uniref:Uncharacterized protein n=1 Tax=Antrodiella citrinella TaxID=2447956 RepID=A0A4S4LZN3_9APHY|nr:hypothetical protein EUX98_g9123 [Antrodiella citrinella]
MLAIQDLQSNDNTTPVSAADSTPLCLPSVLDADSRATCIAGLADAEEKLREAQCFDALDKLRTKIFVRSRLVMYKKNNVRHQGPNTRAQTVLNRHQDKITRLVAKYREARAALLALRGAGSWEEELQVLRDSDIRGMSDDDEKTARKRKKQKKGPAQGSRTISWIWRSTATDGDDGAMTDALRIEFLQSHARVQRWKEHLERIPEELRRAVAFMEHKASWWTQRAHSRTARTDPILVEGLTAYAIRQAYVCTRLAKHYQSIWQEKTGAKKKKKNDAEGGIGNDTNGDGNTAGSSHGKDTGSSGAMGSSDGLSREDGDHDEDDEDGDYDDDESDSDYSDDDYGDDEDEDVAVVVDCDESVLQDVLHASK